MRSTAEEKLEFCPLVPDNALYLPDYVLCVEYTWRSAEFLDIRHRSEVAQYILNKLKNYAAELGWVSA